MFRKFLRDRRGDYMIATAIAIVPIMGGLALAVDYAEITRQRIQTLNALDAAGIATARRIVEGATDDEAKAYAKDFFAANMPGVDTSKTTFTVTLPTSTKGGGLLTIDAEHPYQPYFLSTFGSLIGSEMGDITFAAQTQVRLKNTLEVALVLDNSGSMDYLGSGSGKKRMVLLKDAAKKLVEKLANEAEQMKQVDKPVQFGLVPFAATVNVGPGNASASWMDTQGRSPIHHENFDWSSMTGDKKVLASGGAYYKSGSGWGAEEGALVTRFSLLNEIKRVTGQNWESNWEYGCTKYYWWGGCKKYDWVDNGGWVYTYGPYASWQGCVEARPYPYNTNDTAPTVATPATLYVPTFAPDESDLTSGGWAPNSYWSDNTSGSSSYRQSYMPKYFAPASGISAAGSGQGPNYSCTTKPITPLTDVTKAAGLQTIKDAIDDMASNGATNVPQGLAWGWRVVSSGAPFTEGRSEAENGNDKVVIVLTDGANTYYTPGSLGYSDDAGNKSTYSAYGYAGKTQPGGSYARIFMGTGSGVSKSGYTNSNYTLGMNDHMKQLCDNAKSNDLILMTVSLDLSESKSDEKKAIDALKDCASESRFRKDPTDPSKPARLYWNATGGNLSEKFEEIADELSNLRIVG
ncbi:TadE/TadG family protein [Nitratireductor mangrovi]|uniref:TadE/TadG family protein n=1 Tax=Nitratireductor mangrovi TaxID=2599600 RepID=A0A5B8KV62_9HYPH|nr:pilus assembly protein [Nitratireductor mangrovi]QDY99448.1 TadE/TadG family protein [Nitratireductor mangrovi]